MCVEDSMNIISSLWKNSRIIEDIYYNFGFSTLYTNNRIFPSQVE